MLLIMDFRLTVFLSVAQNLSFTKAANELHISQPAVSRHIQELETEYSTQLFERSGNKVALTAAGEVFMKHAKGIIEAFKVLHLEMDLLRGDFSGKLRVGASTTIAQYMLPQMIARFMALFPEMRFSLETGNTQQIEQSLEDQTIDLGIIEGSHRKHTLKYTHLKNDELVLVTNVKNTMKEEVSIEELATLPLVLREPGSGTLEVIERKLAQHGKRLSQMNIMLNLGSTEGIKLFLQHNLSAFAIVSIHAVSKELINNQLKIIEVTGLSFDREFAFVTTHGVRNEIIDRFQEFVIQNL